MENIFTIIASVFAVDIVLRIFRICFICFRCGQ